MCVFLNMKKSYIYIYIYSKLKDRMYKCPPVCALSATQSPPVASCSSLRFACSSRPGSHGEICASLSIIYIYMLEYKYIYIYI